MRVPPKKDDGYHCPSCDGLLVATPGTMHWRGRSFAALVCRPCNSLWDNPDDSMFAFIRRAAPPSDPAP